MEKLSILEEENWAWELKFLSSFKKAFKKAKGPIFLQKKNNFPKNSSQFPINQAEYVNSIHTKNWFIKDHLTQARICVQSHKRNVNLLLIPAKQPLNNDNLCPSFSFIPFLYRKSYSKINLNIPVFSSFMWVALINWVKKFSSIEILKKIGRPRIMYVQEIHIVFQKRFEL